MFFNQGRISEIFHHYLSNRNRIELAKNLSPGYCHGLALYFCDRALNNKLDSFYDLLTTVAKWDQSEDDKFLQEAAKVQATDSWIKANEKLHAALLDMQIYSHTTLRDKIHWAKEKNKLSEAEKNLLLSTLLPDDPSIEKLLNNIEWLQRKYKLLTKVMTDKEKIDFLDESNSKSIPLKESLDFVTSMNFPREKLPELLEEFPIDRAFLLCIGRHGFSCFRNKEGWQFYDSNNKTKTPIRKTVEEFAKDIEGVYESLGGIKGRLLPLGFIIFTNQNQKSSDTSKLSAICDPYITSENIHHVTSKNADDYPWDKLSPLSLAIIMGAPSDYIYKLIDQSPNLALSDSIGFQPLHYAVFTKRIDIVQYLLAKKIDIHQRILPSEQDKLIPEAKSLHLSLQDATPLHLAATFNDIEMATFLLKNGADINAETMMGLTPLAFAASQGHEKMVQFLINQGANLSARVNISDEIRSKLTKKTSKKMTPLESFGAIDASILNNNSNIAMCAATYGQTNTVLQCLDYGIDINATSSEGLTLLHRAVYLNNIELTKALLSRGANPQALCDFGPKGSSIVVDALVIATLTNNLSMVELLLKHEVREKRETKVNATPAIVIALENGNDPIINALAESSSEQQSLTETSLSLNLAARNAYQAGSESLLNKILTNPYSKDLNLVLEEATKENDFSLIQKLVKEKKVNLETISLSLLLELFDQPDREKIGAFLLKNGLNILSNLELYDRSLIEISLDKRFHKILYPLILDSLKTENKEKINALDQHGNTFLHHAVAAEPSIGLKVLKDLLQIGADPKVDNLRNESAFLYAMNQNNLEAIDIILKFQKEKTAIENIMQSNSSDKEGPSVTISESTEKQDSLVKKTASNFCQFFNNAPVNEQNTQTTNPENLVNKDKSASYN